MSYPVPVTGFVGKDKSFLTKLRAFQTFKIFRYLLMQNDKFV